MAKALTRGLRIPIMAAPQVCYPQGMDSGGAFPFCASDTDEDTQRFARLTPEERLRLFCELCDLTDAIQANRPNRDALRAPHPRSDEAITTWQRLMNRAHGG
jgi:hypothetical protein